MQFFFKTREVKGSTIPVLNSSPYSTPLSKISLSAASSDHVLSPPSQSSVPHSSDSPVTCIRFVFTSVKDAVAILSNSFREAKGSTVPEPNSLPHSTPPSKISLSASSSDHVLLPPSQSSVSNHSNSAVMRYVVHGNIIFAYFIDITFQ